MLKPKKSGLDYSKVDSMKKPYIDKKLSERGPVSMDSLSKSKEVPTSRISAMSKDSISPQLQKKIDAAKERALNINNVGSEAGKIVSRGPQMSKEEVAKMMARKAMMKKRQ